LHNKSIYLTMSLTYHLQEAIDAKLRAIDFSSTRTLQELFDAEINNTSKHENDFINALEAYTSNKAKLILLRKYLSPSNAEKVLNFVTENNYQFYTEREINQLFNYFVVDQVAAA
jgi:hypothetical protein